MELKQIIPKILFDVSSFSVLLFNFIWADFSSTDVDHQPPNSWRLGPHGGCQSWGQEYRGLPTSLACRLQGLEFYVVCFHMVTSRTMKLNLLLFLLISSDIKFISSKSDLHQVHHSAHCFFLAVSKTHTKWEKTMKIRNRTFIFTIINCPSCLSPYDRRDTERHFAICLFASNPAAEWWSCRLTADQEAALCQPDSWPFLLIQNQEKLFNQFYFLLSQQVDILAAKQSNHKIIEIAESIDMI